jgi:hypothetical protein
MLIVLVLGLSQQSDPRFRFAHGGVADFRGRDNTTFNILSVPNLSLNMKTRDVTTLLPRPSLVNGSFFTEAYVTIEAPTTMYIQMLAHEPGFRMCDAEARLINGSYMNTWTDFNAHGIRVLSKLESVLVRAHGWEMNITKVRIEYPIKKQRKYRLELKLALIDDPEYGTYDVSHVAPHGLLGQSFDANEAAIDGEVTNYDAVKVDVKEQAAGAIEGSFVDYIVSRPFDTSFKYSRYSTTQCTPARDLSGWKVLGTKKWPVLAEICDKLGEDDFHRLVQY